MTCLSLIALHSQLTIRPQPPGKGAKMAAYVNYRMRITMSDARIIIGTFLAYDKFMNIILADSEEFRKVRIGNSAYFITIVFFLLI